MNLKEHAESILGRKIKDNEGINLLEIERQEKKLNISLPNELKEFYTLLGNNKLFTEGFQRFASVNELFIKDNKLVFLLENQSVIYWAVDLNDFKTIYQTTNQDFTTDVQWCAEEFELSEFIEMMLYMQCVMADEYYHNKSQSGFLFFGSLDTTDNEIVEKIIDYFEDKLTLIINKKNIRFYKNLKTIFLCFFNENNFITDIFTCSKDEEYFDKLITDFGFSEL